MYSTLYSLIKFSSDHSMHGMAWMVSHGNTVFNSLSAWRFCAFALDFFRRGAYNCIVVYIIMYLIRLQHSKCGRGGTGTDPTSIPSHCQLFIFQKHKILCFVALSRSSIIRVFEMIYYGLFLIANFKFVSHNTASNRAGDISIAIN